MFITKNGFCDAKLMAKKDMLAELDGRMLDGEICHETWLEERAALNELFYSVDAITFLEEKEAWLAGHDVLFVKRG